MPRPGKLTEEQQAYIVHALAAFRTPQEIVEAVNDKYGLKLTRQSVQGYDPAHGRPAAKWRAIFAAARARAIRDIARCALAHQSFRLQELTRIYREADRVQNHGLALLALELAAKECGGMFTSRRAITHLTVSETIQGAAGSEVSAG